MYQITEIIERLAVAIRKLTTSASAHYGADCMMQAQLTQCILREQGIETRIVVGEAAWRVGPGDGDAIVHSPRIGGHAPVGTRALAYHAWLEYGDTILDFTTHSLKAKAQALDATDGGKTEVLWAPAVLVMPRDETVPLNEFIQTPVVGTACYTELPKLREFIEATAPIGKPDPADLQALRILFQNPETHVVGPNHISGKRLELAL